MLPSRLASLAVRHTRSDRSNSHMAPLATRKRRRFFVEWVIPPMSDELEIIAHRGASWDAPENSRAAVELAWRQGADAVEADFRLTRDGRIVASHDDSLKRVTGVDLRHFRAFARRITATRHRKLERATMVGRADRHA